VSSLSLGNIFLLVASVRLVVRRRRWSSVLVRSVTRERLCRGVDETTTSETATVKKEVASLKHPYLRTDAELVAELLYVQERVECQVKD
jgi:hypothetical protein